MSIKVMSSVWDHSTQTGTGLLMLLAIADNANEYGEAWPSVDTLAAKCRMKRRNAQVLLAELAESGELTIGYQAGPPTPYGPVNLYTIITPGALVRDGVQNNTPHAKQYTPGVQSTAPDAKNSAPHALQYTPGVQSSVVGGAKLGSQGVHSFAPRTVIKPSLTTTTNHASYDVGFGGGGGDERMETDDEGNSPEDSQWEEAETANVKADLVDALAALGVRPEMAKRAVDAKTVTSDRDVILCKRFIQSSTAHTPAAVLWLQYLSVGRLPPAPYSDTSTVSEAQIAAARRLADEADARSPEPDQYVGPRAMAAVLAGSPLKHIARSPLAIPGRTAP